MHTRRRTGRHRGANTEGTADAVEGDAAVARSDGAGTNTPAQEVR